MGILTNPAEFRRRAAGVSLLAGPLLVFAGVLATPWEGSDDRAAYLAALADNPAQAQVSAVLLVLGYALLVPAAVGMIHLVRGRGAVLAHLAGALAVVGGAILPGLVAGDFYDLSLAQSLERQRAVEVLDRLGEYGGTLVILPLAVAGAFLGITLLTVALWRARFVRPWVPLATLAGFVVFALVGTGTLLPAALGTGLVLLALGSVGAKVLGLSGEEWERGPCTAEDRGRRRTALAV